MATKKKMLQAAAGNAGGGGLDVAEVFGTYVEATGAGTTTVDQGIDLSGEGGLWWGKIRNLSGDPDGRHELHDTERGAGNYLRSDSTAAETASSFNFLSSFTSTGYTGWSGVNGYNVASWTFRKAPKFFDVVTYTGTGSARTISHNLGSVPGMIIVKVTSGRTDSWIVYHRSRGATEYAKLDTTDAFYTGPAAATTWNTTEPTSTEFTLGSDGGVNQSGATYVAYLFAHNDGDGGFGPNADQDIIKCGSYVGTGSQVDVDLGFEPQWILTRRADDPDDWYMLDTMRGIATSGDDAYLRANLSSSEGTGVDIFDVTATGFKTKVSPRHTNGGTYIYIAIRRGPLAQPESGTEVFVPAVTGLNTSGTSFPATFTPDYLLASYGTTGSGDNWYGIDRMRGGTSLSTNTTDAETSPVNSNYNLRFDGGMSGNWTGYVSWMWKRAPGFFDVVAYTGSNSDQNVSHNLGAVPEMMWVKCRSGFTENWACYHKDLGNTTEINLNTTGVPVTSSAWANTTPTDSVFTVGGDYVPVSKASTPYIAYLFASIDGISKVGSYVGNGGTLAVDCGFSSGARFVLFRNITTSNGDWTIADTTRGIVSGNDSALNLNDTSAAITNEDFIDPNSSGFTVVNASGFVDSNTNGHTYLFYAIA